MLIDTHCHLHDMGFYTFPMAIDNLHRAKRKGVNHIICVSTSLEDAVEARSFAFEITKENAIRRTKVGPLETKIKYDVMPKVGWTFGIHPEHAKDVKEARELGRMAKEEAEILFEEAAVAGVPNKDLDWENEEGEEMLSMYQLMPLVPILPLAIGEIGLDYHYDYHNRIAQIRLFEDMLQIADKHDLPVAFHVREAFDDFFPVVANFPKLQGVVHSFSDNKKNLKRILEDTHFYVGVNGLATYSTLPLPPLERIVLETDAPYLTPEPFRGIINRPSYVREVADWLAAKLDVDIKEIEQETTKNARRLFQI